MDKIKQTVATWKRSRQATISSLRYCANVLRKSHEKNAQVEYDSASASLVGDLVGLGGVFLAPFSGGLSLAAVGFSSVVGIGSYLNKRDANKQDEDTTSEAVRKVDRALEQDKLSSESLNSISKKLVYVVEQLNIMEVEDILLSLEESIVIKISKRAKEIRISDLENKLQQQKNAKMSIPGLDLSKQAANLNAALTSAEQVVMHASMTKQAYTGTRTIRQVVSTAQSVNKVTQTAKSLDTAKQAAVMTIQATESVGKVTVRIASVARDADGLVKTAGVVSSATKSARVAVDIVTATGQAASTAKCVTNAAKAGTLISTATKGTDMTFKTVKNIKQASNTVKTVTQVTNDSAKALRTTRITTNAARTTKVSATATKAASFSKVGLAINAVVIPFDIYNFISASGNLNQSYEDVARFEDLANSLEKELNEIQEGVTKLVHECEDVYQLYVLLSKMYEDHRIELIFYCLRMIHKELGFE